jgi:hypothetical protein
MTHRGAELHPANNRPSEPEFDVSRGTSLVRLALVSHLDAHRRPDGSTGRKTLARWLQVSEPTITERLKGKPAVLLSLVYDAARLGLAPDAQLSDLARRVGVDDDPHSWASRVDPRLWHALRDATGLGPSSTPNFRAPVDVLLAAGALVASHPRFTSREANLPELPPDDLLAAHALTEPLCRIASGPFGFSAEASSALAVLAPFTFSTIRTFLSSSPVGTNVVRAIDHALRTGPFGSAFAQAAQQLIANPPVLLFRNALWMRAVRRVMWIDRMRGVDRVKWWALEQARRGARGDGAYAWSGPVERRYALWVQAEYTALDDERAWDAVRAAGRSFGEHFAADLEQAYVTLTRARAEHRPADLFFFRPSSGWTPPASIAGQLARLLGEHRSRGAVADKDRGRFGLRSAADIAAVRELIAEALLSPCTIRHRTAVDTLKACSARVRDDATRVVAELLDASTSDGGPVEEELVPFVERCVHLLGALCSDAAVDPVIALLRRPGLPPPVLKVAILTSGDLAHAHDAHADTLIALACSVARRDGGDPCIAAAVHACVGVGEDPRRLLDHGLAAAGGPERAAMFAWSDETLADPLLRRRRT